MRTLNPPRRRCGLRRTLLALASVLVPFSGRDTFAFADDYTQPIGTTDNGGTDLGGDLITRTNVQEYADLSLDVRDLASYAAQQQAAAAIDIYKTGLHAEYREGFAWPLQKLSDDLANSHVKTPHYLFHLYGLADRSTTEWMRHTQALDEMVQETLASSLDHAQDAVLILMWVYSLHLLFNGVYICHHRTAADNPDLFELGGGGMDEFISFWIGADQEVASDNGHGLYAWAQRMGEAFGTATPEATVNANLKLLYQGGAGVLAANGACSPYQPHSAAQLWNAVVQMSRQVMVPLLQSLIFHLRQDDAVAARLYAQAVVPQLSQCRPSLYDRLNESLLGNAGVRLVDKDVVQADLYESLACFGLTCDDLGALGSADDLPVCKDAQWPGMAGYRPTSDVKSLSRFDMDVYQMHVLSQLEESTDAFTSFWYHFGYNMDQARYSDTDPFALVSLQSLATRNDREVANPLYTDFVRYYNDKNYADTVLQDIFNDDSKWTSEAQQSTVIASTTAFQISYMQIVVKLHKAVSTCEAVNDPYSVPVWNPNPVDEVAALWIGSMEGTALGGSSNREDGQLLYHLANLYGPSYGTVNSEDRAQVNNEIFALLYAAKAELDALDCLALSQSTRQLEVLLNVAVVQATLTAAVDASHEKSGSNATNIAQTETMARAILPLLDTIDPASAQVVAENCLAEANVKPVREGAQELAEAMGNAISQLGLSCHKYLGESQYVQPCRGQESAAETPQLTTLTAGVVLGLLLLVGTL